MSTTSTACGWTRGPSACGSILLSCATGSWRPDRKSTRLNSSHPSISYAVFCLKKKKLDPRTRKTTEYQVPKGSSPYGLWVGATEAGKIIKVDYRNGTFTEFSLPSFFF